MQVNLSIGCKMLVSFGKAYFCTPPFPVLDYTWISHLGWSLRVNNLVCWFVLSVNV